MRRAREDGLSLTGLDGRAALVVRRTFFGVRRWLWEDMGAVPSRAC